MKYLLGIDQGTTQTTAIVVDEHASFVDVNSIPLPARFPRPGWVEQDPHDIVRTVKEAVAPLRRRPLEYMEHLNCHAARRAPVARRSCE